MIGFLRWKMLFLMVFFSFGTVGFSQLDELDVETEIKRVSDNEFVLVFDYSIDEDWHLYCQHNPDSASQAMAIEATDEDQKDFEFIKEKNGDSHKESKHHKEFSNDFDVDQTFFSDEAKIKQKIRILNDKVRKINITVSGQACNDSCVPYEQEFEFIIKKKGKSEKKGKKGGKRKKGKKERKEGREGEDTDSFTLTNKSILFYLGVVVLTVLLIIILFFIFRKKKN